MGLTLVLLSWLPASCGVGCRHCSDPVLMWLWLWPAATALIQLLAWEPPYAVGAALKRPKKKKKKRPAFGLGLSKVKPGEWQAWAYTAICQLMLRTRTDHPRFNVLIYVSTYFQRVG